MEKTHLRFYVPAVQSTERTYYSTYLLLHIIVIPLPSCNGVDICHTRHSFLDEIMGLYFFGFYFDIKQANRDFIQL